MSYCSCVLSSADEGELASYYTASRPTAQKQHTCTECRRTIQPGETYERVVAVWVGHLHVVNTCEDCKSIIDEMFCEGLCHGFMLEDLREHISEVEVVSEDCLLSLTPRARGMICDLIEERWKRNEEDGVHDDEPGEYPGGYGSDADSQAAMGTLV
jgi:hypothetical protein